MIEYRLLRSDRRTLSIIVDGTGALVVRAPRRMAVREIEAFIAQKQRWIAEKQEAARRRTAGQRQLAQENRIPFWGGTLTIAFTDAKKAVLQDGILWLPTGEQGLQQARKWRLQQAESLIVPRVECWAEKTGLVPSRIAFGSARTRWGSMNARTRSLRLNAALVHCPQDIVDYVVVHELAHIIHPNHSAAFHALVRTFLPDADERREALKAYSGMIGLWQQAGVTARPSHP